MNLEPVSNVYTVEAEQKYERIPQQSAQQTSGQGSVPIGVQKLPEGYKHNLYRQLELLEDDDEKQKQVVIPRYNGAKNTRVDFWKFEHNRIVVSGIPNHPQPSCVYLRGVDQIEFEKYTDQDLRYNNFQPKTFYLQRQWSKLQFEAQNMNSSLEIPIQEYIKLAPYICDHDKIVKYCTPRYGVVEQTHLNPPTRTVLVQSFEPLLSFQSGWAILDAIRPFNQQNMFFPLAIQDYSIQMFPFQDAKEPGRYFRNVFYRGNGFQDDIGTQGSNVYQNRGRTMYRTEYADPALLNYYRKVYEEEIQHNVPTDVELVAFSQNDVIQKNKDVSDVMLHAPDFVVSSKIFRLDLEDDTEVSINLSDRDEPVTIQFNSALGLPSLIMLYVEFADYSDGDSFIHGSQPRIDSLRIQLFNQDIPIVKNLSSSELRYITQKNSHPNCQKDIQLIEPIVLLDLESLGLGKDLPGYPSRDRVSAQITLSTFTLPGIPRRQYATEAEDTADDDITLNFIFKCVFIYENRVLEGNVNQMKINRKY